MERLKERTRKRVKRIFSSCVSTTNFDRRAFKSCQSEQSPQNSVKNEIAKLGAGTVSTESDTHTHY